MKLIPIKANMTELELANGTKVLFSYQTPVACWFVDGDKQVLRKTQKKWSRTTTRHINQWIVKTDNWTERMIDTMPQEYFDSLVV